MKISLGQFKELVRTGNLPLSQIAKRVTEYAKINILKPKKEYPYIEDAKKCEKQVLANCIGNFKKINLRERFFLSNDLKNKWFLTKCSKIVEMINGTYNEGCLCVYGKPIKTKDIFFKKPILSSHLDIYTSTTIIFDTARLFKISEIKCKMFAINSKDDVVFVPIIHSFQ